MILFFETLRLLGEVTVGYTALRVHHRVLREHSIDDQVEKIMKREQKVGIFGVALIIIGFVGATYFERFN